MFLMAQFGFGKPAFGEFVTAVCHIFAAEDSHFQHLSGCQFGLKAGIEIFAIWFCQYIGITALHTVIDSDGAGVGMI